MILKDLKRYIENELCNLYNPYESESIAYLIIENILSFDKTQIIINYRNYVKYKDLVLVDDILERLKKHEPIQYIFEETEFFNLKLKVNKHTLIPRQETELLVYNIIKKNEQRKNINILDIGTGSGCIAISLAKNIPSSNVSATDISENTLHVAYENAKKNKTNINFIIEDVLKSNNEQKEKFDIILSNPPYVTEKEKKQMQKNVLNFEPKSALFVPNEKPLIFYEAIIFKAKKMLNTEGQLWFEINEKYGKEVAQLMKTQGFNNIEVIKDYNNKDRIVFGTIL